MIKLINNITQIIILLGCCAISIFILKEISKLELTNLCAVRAHNNRSSCAYYKPCADISMCKLCFLNANNYLNVLKYIKHNKNKFPLKSTL